MAIYTDASCILDTDTLISAETCNGAGEFDGVYGIHVLLALRGRWREANYMYPTLEARDAAFAEIGRLAWEGETTDLVLPDDDADDSAGWEGLLP